jgi:hypothetical protein
VAGEDGRRATFLVAWAAVSMRPSPGAQTHFPGCTPATSLLAEWRSPLKKIKRTGSSGKKVTTD